MGNYLKQRRRWLVLLAVCVLVFVVSFLLYHLPVAAVLYPSGLCAALQFLSCLFGGRGCPVILCC